MVCRGYSLAGSSTGMWIMWSKNLWCLVQTWLIKRPLTLCSKLKCIDCFLDRTWEEKEGRRKESSWGWGCCESFAIQSIWKAPVLQFEGSNQYNKAASSEYCIFFQSKRSRHCSSVLFLNFIVNVNTFCFNIVFYRFCFRHILKQY